MRTIAERKLLLRVGVELPRGLRPATEEFREGWNFSRSVDARCLEKRILKRGWNFIKVENGTLRSGVGQTSQEAIGNALKLALRQVSEQLNAAEVVHIELTQYPWFFLARLSLHPYRIQEGAYFPVPEDAGHFPTAPRRGRRSRQSAALISHFASAIPRLKQTLVSSRGSGKGPL